MQQLNDSVALGVPAFEEGAFVEAAVRSARNAAVRVDVVCGIGLLPVGQDVPVRVLGYAACAARVIRDDLRRIVGHRAEVHVRIFSTAMKLAFLSRGTVEKATARASGLRTLAALASSLRAAGVAEPILADFADARFELPAALAKTVRMQPHILARLLTSAENNHNGADPLAYASEHAAPSMFGDLRATNDLQVTLGGTTEATFWAVRRRIARLAVWKQPVAPSLALLMVGLRRPWYAPTENEPGLGELKEAGTAVTCDRLRDSFDPARGGNAGLAREAKKATALIVSDRAHLVCDACADPRRALAYLRQNCGLGPNLSQLESIL